MLACLLIRRIVQMANGVLHHKTQEENTVVVLTSSLTGVDCEKDTNVLAASPSMTQREH